MCIRYQWFWPKPYFYGTHDVYFSISLANTFLFGEEWGDNRDPPTPIVERKTKDIETIVNVINQHKQKGREANERSTLSPNVSQKSGPPKQSF